MAAHIPFVDHGLARRLERAEANGSAGFVEARMALEPGRGAVWMVHNGTYAMFDGVGSPVTQTFGLGLESPASPHDLETLERFFLERGADVCHEVSPLAGIEVFTALSSRGYTPVELTSVMFQPISLKGGSPLQESGGHSSRLKVRQISGGEADMFGATAARGWSELPELRGFLESFGRVMASRTNGPCFVAELDGTPIATGVLVVSDGVALLAGAATIPEYRRLGAQLALLDARLHFAAAQGCDIAMMCAAPGSSSQRNAERHGFRIAYTRVKWQLRRV